MRRDGVLLDPLRERAEALAEEGQTSSTLPSTAAGGGDRHRRRAARDGACGRRGAPVARCPRGAADRRQPADRDAHRPRARDRRDPGRGAAGRQGEDDRASSSPRGCAWPWSVTASTTLRRSRRRMSGSRSAPARTSRWRPPTSSSCAPIRSTLPPRSRSAAERSARCARTSAGPSATTSSRCRSRRACSSRSGSTLRPEIGAIAMSGSSVIVALNALALKRLHLDEPVRDSRSEIRADADSAPVAGP